MADVKWLIYRLEQMAQTPLNYDAGLVRETIAALSHAAGQEAVETLIEEVQAFADAYPTDVFGPVTDEERAQHGSLITRASASMGRHMGRRFLPKVLALRNPSQPTTSAEVGQDGEQCRAASGEVVAWIRPDGVTTSDAGLMRHWEAQGLQFDPLIRALSRGVPEGK